MRVNLVPPFPAKHGEKQTLNNQKPLPPFFVVERGLGFASDPLGACALRFVGSGLESAFSLSHCEKRVGEGGL